jgi:HD-GYP domain-containing protein (c-di-GMP phosphodiesterase class II)
MGVTVALSFVACGYLLIGKEDAIALSDASGVEAMAKIIAGRADGPYEAELARIVSAKASALMEGIAATVDRDTILALEPDPPATLDETECDEAFLAIADMIDMRMPFTQGHSRALAELAEAGGREIGMPAADIRAVRWSGHVHDIGELVVLVATMAPHPMALPLRVSYLTAAKQPGSRCRWRHRPG